MYNLIKRLADLFVSAIALVLLSPLLIPIMIGLRLTGEGYIFYLQERVGYQQKRFNIYKFATMLKNSPNMGTGDITLKNDPRITPMGPFLRKTKINELPQLINVFMGQMSIVGPRPLMPVSFAMYQPEHAEKVYHSKPGITGIGSLIFRDEESLVTNAKERGIEPRTFYLESIYPYKGQLEMWYQSHKSFYTDLMIILLTAWAILFPTSNLAYRIFKDLPERPKDI